MIAQNIQYMRILDQLRPWGYTLAETTALYLELDLRYERSKIINGFVSNYFTYCLPSVPKDGKNN